MFFKASVLRRRDSPIHPAILHLEALGVGYFF
jgi:hypothetical protein